MVNMIYAPIQLAEATGSPKPDEYPDCPVKAKFQGESINTIWLHLKNNCDSAVQRVLISVLVLAILGTLCTLGFLFHHLCGQAKS